MECSSEPLIDNSKALFLKWCGALQARGACERWHYTKTCPSATASLAVYEHGEFIGVIQFGSGNRSIGSPYGLESSNCRELVRVALKGHYSAVSRMIAVALKLVRTRMPHVRLIVSYADSNQGHHGGIYQAGGWIYVGPVPSHTYFVEGKSMHGRSIHSKYGPGSQTMAWLRKHVDPAAKRVILPGKHKYLMPLDAEMSLRIAPLSKPYPKRAAKAL